MIIFKFRYIQTHQMPSKATNPENKSQIQKTNPRPACKVFLTSEVLMGLGGRRGTQRVIYKSLAKVSGSDDNVASILLFVFVVCIRVSICIWIGICVCICAILEEAVVPYPALDGALPYITIPPNHLPCWWHLPWHWWRFCFENDNEKKLTSSTAINVDRHFNLPLQSMLLSSLPATATAFRWESK